jgi:predicted permease
LAEGPDGARRREEQKAMAGLGDGWRRLVGVLRRGERAQRLDEEMRFHLEMLAERHVRAGLDPESARVAALREFGGVDRFGEASRDEYRSRGVEELVRDVRHAVRALVRMPVFTLAALLTLALGIGATTVVFSIVDHVVLRPLPYDASDRLVLVRETLGGDRELGARAAHYLEWRERCEACEDIAAMRPIGATWTDGLEPARLGAVRVSANLFPLLGVRAAHGRLFRPDEDAADHDAVVILSHAFWTTHFGGDASVIGRTLTINDRQREVVGVLPPRFRLPKGDGLGPRTGMPDDPELFVPLALTQAELDFLGNWHFVAVARLAPGVSRAHAQAQLDALQQSIAAGWPQPIELGAVLVPLHEQVVGDARRGLLLLLAAVGAVLLLVCVNLANLMLARNASRSRESAVRAALGARRGRLVRESLTESVVLGVAAGAIGLLVSQWGLHALLALAPAGLPRLHEVRLDGRIAGAALLLSIGTGLLFGALPALRAAAALPGDVLREGGRSRGDGRRAGRARSTLIAAQLAMTAILLVAAGLFLSSFVRVLGIDKGFHADRALAMDVVVPRAEYRDFDELVSVYDRVLDRLRATPGVASAAVASRLPLEGVLWTDVIRAPDDPRPAAELPVGYFHFVTAAYFETLGIRLTRGRSFAEADRGANVVVLSERALANVWPGEDPVGRRVRLGQLEAEVIGVAADVTTTGLEEEASAIAYLPPWTPFGMPAAASVVVRTAMPPAHIAGAARAAVREASPGIAIARVRTMAQLVDAATAARRFQLTLLAVFAATALLTACIGIYGVIAHSLARRRAEIGVRMALGARRSDIHRLVLREGLGAAGVGLAVGIAAAISLGRLVESLLYEVRPADPLVIGVVTALLGAVAALAAYVPARRASARGADAVLREG